ncbi:MAG: hypothetical protein MUE48_06385 [Desulfobacterales bacterium]|jgi:hypothetical protein|nr:hypothetical protein [Desulfobacterales bacterium]
MVLRRAVFVLACACGVAYGGAPPPAQTAAMTRVVSDNPPFILYKPAAWTLRQSAVGETLNIAVASPDGQSVAEVAFTDNRRQRLDAQQVLAQRVRELKARHPDLSVTAASACKDTPPSCAEASLAYTAGGTGMRGRFFFHGDPNVSTVRSYRAPASRLPQERALLLDILTNIHVREPRPLKVQFVPRRAADRSLSIELPADWSFLAQKGAIVAAAPQGRAGFVFTVFTVVPQSYGVAPQPGVIVAPYRPPQAFVHDIFAQFKNRQTRVVAWQPDSQATAACPSQIGRQCEVADMQVGWLSPEGVPCQGGFKILNAQPNTAGHWFSIVAGIWGPADDLARHLPVLEHVAKSFAINDAYARRYIEHGLARLRELQQKTRQAIQDLYKSIEQNQRDYEARSARKEASDAKWDDYRRGNSYWVSDLEGGKVYQTDPWGTRDTSGGTRYDGTPYSYIHFEGQNPAHPSEHMREISSYELKQMNR